MRNREPKPWPSGAPGPYLWIEKEGVVEVRALGADRLSVTAPGQEQQIVTGYDGAERPADALAERLG
jgi:hypothetical protein